MNILVKRGKHFEHQKNLLQRIQSMKKRIVKRISQLNENDPIYATKQVRIELCESLIPSSRLSWLSKGEHLTMDDYEGKGMIQMIF